MQHVLGNGHHDDHWQRVDQVWHTTYRPLDGRMDGGKRQIMTWCAHQANLNDASFSQLVTVGQCVDPTAAQSYSTTMTASSQLFSFFFRSRGLRRWSRKQRALALLTFTSDGNELERGDDHDNGDAADHCWLIHSGLKCCHQLLRFRCGSRQRTDSWAVIIMSPHVLRLTLSALDSTNLRSSQEEEEIWTRSIGREYMGYLTQLTVSMM